MSVLAKSARPPLVVQVEGLKGSPEENVQEALKNLQGLLRYPLNQSEVNSFYRKAPLNIKKALQPFGFFHPHIQSQLQKTNGQWHALFVIDPGPAMPVTAIDLQVTGPGEEDPVFIHLLHNFPIHTDTPLDIPAYHSAKRDFYNIASERGYFKARMAVSRIIINMNTYQAKIIFHFRTGIRYHFGETTFNHVPYSIHFIRRYMLFHQGEPYLASLVQDTQQDLTNSGYFRQVIITPQPELAHGNEVPIHVKMIPRKSRQYIVGAGYGTDTGVRGSLGVTFRRVNKFGHRFTALAQVATGNGSNSNSGNTSITGTYTIPGRHPAKDTWTFSGGYNRLRFNTYTTGNQLIENSSDSGKIAASYSVGLGDWQQTIALNALNESYKLPSFNPNLPTINAKMIYPSISWQILKTDNTLSPNNGYRFIAAFAGTPAFLASNNGNNEDGSSRENGGFMQLRLTGSFLHTFKATHTRLLFRASYGHTVISSIENLPLSLQLFAGGVNSIRGFSYNSIGPGRDLILGSFEIQQRVYKGWYIAAFVDAGNISNNPNPFIDFNNFINDINIGVGPAIVWLSPIGALEVSIATPISNRNLRYKRWILSFSMGPQL